MHQSTGFKGKINSFIFIAFFFIAIICMLIAVQSNACEIEFSVNGDEKDSYNIGDEIIVLLTVKFTHNVCPEGIKLTDYATDGLNITAATKWKEISPNIWKRKLKLKVEGNPEGKLTLSASRTCEKEGGFGSIKFQSKPAKMALQPQDTTETY